MATYYLEVTAGGDLLSVDGTTILAFQTGSEEGGDTTAVNITPVFDVADLPLPDDIEVYYRYSVDGGSFGSWDTASTLNLTDGEYVVEAQLRYSASIPVTDENGAQVAVQTTSFTVGASSGTAPTFDATPAASATDPTVGDSVSVTSYAASGDPAPTVSFEWFVGGVSQAETTDTFDTTGLSGGETLTCTVTASNGVNPDATASVDFGTVAAANDWDTNADGQFTSNNTQTGSFETFDETAASSTYDPVANARVTSSGIQARTTGNVYSSNPGTYAAVYANWGGSDPGNAWRAFEWNGDSTFGTRFVLVDTNGGSWANNDSWTDIANNPVTITLYAAEPDVTGWSAP